MEKPNIKLLPKNEYLLKIFDKSRIQFPFLAGGWLYAFIDLKRKIKGTDVVELLRYLFAVRGEPGLTPSDNGPEFTSNAVKKWLKASGIRKLFIVPNCPWENGYVEAFNSKLRDELLNRELFLHIDELRYIVDRWRMDYNHYRPHSSLDYMAPAAFAAKCLEQGSGTLRLPQDKGKKCGILS